MPPGHRSQSEADWAYAKRALARGDSPEEIVRRIADYRADDKADPFYYAHLTVEKAKAEIERRSASIGNTFQGATQDTQSIDMSQSPIGRA